MSTRVLVIGYVWPEPNSSAAGSHMLSLLRLYRRQGWQVEFASPAQLSEHMADLAAEGISQQSIVLNCDSFDAYITQFSPDIVMFDRFMMEEQFGWRVEKHCPHALRVLDTEDLQCLRHARHQALKAEQDMSLAYLFSDLAKREIAAILRCDLSLIISDYEMQLLQETFKVDTSLLLHLPFMVETTLPATTLSFEQRQHFITIGNFRHAPNWDAVLYLQQIWPLIRKQLPTAELHIYGSYPPPKATALHNPNTGFLIKGWADDALQVMEQARVCLAPLRFGAGIKGKLLDAMLVNTPSVTTAIGSEGMQGEQPWPGVVVSNINHAQQFADAAVALYQDKACWQQAQHATQPLLSQRYNATLLGERLIKRLHYLAAHLEEHRLANFTGSMLRHHTMKSTQYMAQWIAAKNAGNT
ncbi:glycosyltransferase [Oceanisphaera avium]|uniref:Glycosyltransferase n=1 Tax=Oceanisphaera avium TaxID=1903694 RepID=A0A1Y0CZ73_9GAMM|nr:glycosyltransferase [Oceanisphaera avium]ART80609.1 glycosyltransferase [Oceanisphaera avium]